MGPIHLLNRVHYSPGLEQRENSVLDIADLGWGKDSTLDEQ